MEVDALDKVDARLARMEDLLHQLIGMVAKTNTAMAEMEERTKSAMVEMEARLMERTGGIEERIDHLAGTIHRDVTIPKSRKLGVVERDLAVVRRQG